MSKRSQSNSLPFMRFTNCNEFRVQEATLPLWSAQRVNGNDRKIGNKKKGFL